MCLFNVTSRYSGLAILLLVSQSNIVFVCVAGIPFVLLCFALLSLPYYSFKISGIGILVITILLVITFVLIAAKEAAAAMRTR